MVPPVSGRRLAVGACVLALLAVAVAPGFGGTAVAGAVESSGASLQQETPTNETVRHEDPDEVDRRGDLAAVEAYLAERLDERLGEGTASISRGQYEAARSVLGEEYDADLDRYVEVAGETAAGDDDGATEAFRDAREEARTFANESERFEETDRAYRRASERGDEAEARELARELVARAAAVDRAGDRTDRAYGELGNRTGRDFSESREQVRAVSRNATERAATVAEATFVRTRLSARADAATVSFLAPVTVEGRLVDENGTGLANETVLVGVPPEAVRVETDASGEFEASYRPVRLPVEPGEVPVRFVPANGSGYLGNRTTVAVTVEPVTPTVTAEVEPEAVGFGDPLTVRGSVEAGGTPAEAAPILVSVSGLSLARGETDASGRFEVSRPLPADVPAGDGTVEVAVDQTGRALAGASAGRPVAVEPTATTLSVGGTLGGNETAVVSGRLLTADGTGVGDRRVRISVGGATVETVETDATGRFSARLPPGSYEVGEDGDVTVAARFDGAGTNLEGSDAEVTLSAPWIEGEGGGIDPWRALAATAALVLVAVGAGLVVRRAGRGPDADEGAVTRSGAEEGGAAAAADRAWREDVAALLSGGETDRAVARAYAAARAGLAAELAGSGSLTHWEFYAAAREDGVGGERVEALRSLTAAYERARFAPSSVSAADAEAAVESAGAVLE